MRSLRNTFYVVCIVCLSAVFSYPVRAGLNPSLAHAETEYLSQLSSVSGAPFSGPAQVNGSQYPQSISVTAYEEGNSVEYDLSRQWGTLTATIGVSDDAPSDAEAYFEVFGDGEQIYRERLAFGQSEEISLDVGNVLRLRLQNTGASGDGSFYVVWGDARVEG